MLYVVDLMLALQIDIWVGIFVAKMFPEMCKDTSAVMQHKDLEPPVTSEQ